MSLTLTLHGRVPSKKNSKQWIIRGGKKFLVPSKNHAAWLDTTLWEIMSQRPKKGIERCGIDMVFYMPDNRISDLSNKAESIMDALVDAGVIIDDRWQVVRPLNLDCVGVDKKDPRVVVTITEYDSL